MEAQLCPLVEYEDDVQLIQDTLSGVEKDHQRHLEVFKRVKEMNNAGDKNRGPIQNL